MAKLPKVLPAQKGDVELKEHDEPLMERIAPKAKKKLKPMGDTIAPAQEKKTKPSGGTDIVAP